MIHRATLILRCRLAQSWQAAFAGPVRRAEQSRFLLLHGRRLERAICFIITALSAVYFVVVPALAPKATLAVAMLLVVAVFGATPLLALLAKDRRVWALLGLSICAVEAPLLASIGAGALSLNAAIGCGASVGFILYMQAARRYARVRELPRTARSLLALQVISVPAIALCCFGGAGFSGPGFGGPGYDGTWLAALCVVSLSTLVLYVRFLAIWRLELSRTAPEPKEIPETTP